jgi:hypothetical protein
MRPTPIIAVAAVVTVCAASFVAAMPEPVAAQAPAGAAQRVDLAERLASGKLHVVNREAAKAPDRAGAVRVSEKEGSGVAWIDGTDFATGTIEIDVRGKDVLQQSFLGVAFHRKDDATYETVYLRPFNFRAEDPARHQHAVQYVSMPDYDWPRLRKEFPEEFENPVDQSIDPNGWVPLRIVVQPQRVQIFAGPDKTPALEVRKLGQLDRGMVGLWVGNTSGGDFANLRITAGK